MPACIAATRLANAIKLFFPALEKIDQSFFEKIVDMGSRVVIEYFALSSIPISVDGE